MVGEKQSRACDQNEETLANVDDLNGLVSCDAATLARAINSYRPQPELLGIVGRLQVLGGGRKRTIMANQTNEIPIELFQAR
jgi:hypothetical protein